MNGVAEQIADLKRQIEAKGLERARAQARAEAAQQALQEARKALREVHGVETLEDAKARHASLQASLESAIQTIRTALQDA